MKYDRRRRGQSRRACLDFDHAPCRTFPGDEPDVRALRLPAADGAGAAGDAVTALRLSIVGQVQGVGYRAWTVREAMRRDLRGWVRNRRDGSVEALLIGETEAVAGMAAACRLGPPLAQVIDVRQSPAEDDGSADFLELPTD